MRIKSLSDETQHMGRPYDSRNKLLELLSDGKPRGSRDVAESLDFTHRAAESVCYRGWKAGLLLRAEKPIRELNSTFAGRAGHRYNTRSYYLFTLQNDSEEEEVQKLKFLSFAKTPKIIKSNKSQIILNFLRENVDRAFYTTDIAKSQEPRYYNSGRSSKPSPLREERPSILPRLQERRARNPIGGRVYRYILGPLKVLSQTVWSQIPIES